MEITIRRATENDAKKIFEWRNDLDSIAMSLSSKIIDWKTHEKWYDLALNDQNTLITICESKSLPFQEIGMVRFNFTPIKKNATVSINLNPEARGNSLGHYCLKASISYAKKTKKNLSRIIADIKKENIASIKTFEKAGFDFLEIPSKESLRYVYKL